MTEEELKNTCLFCKHGRHMSGGMDVWCELEVGVSPILDTCKYQEGDKDEALKGMRTKTVQGE